MANQVKKISEEEFDSKKHVKEYKRKCNECKKVWHSLVSREKEMKKNIEMNDCSQGAFCCNPSAQLQANRNRESGTNELDKLKKCPNCGSKNYTEDVIIYEKK